jgi:hypothetical protein
MRFASLSSLSGLAALCALGCSSGDPSIAVRNTATAQALVCTPSDHPTSPASLLTRAQYDATIADLLGDDSHPSASFPPENQVQGFNNNTEVHIANPLLVEQFMDAAEGIAARAVTQNLNLLAACSDTTVSGQQQCGAAFVTSFGKRAFRRPLSADEASAFNSLLAAQVASQDYPTAIKLVIEAMLQSPQFLYRVDSAAAPTSQTGAIALGPYEVASRLSYFLTGSMPDDALFAAADRGELASASEVEAQARRLLESPRAHDVVRDFNHQWLQLDQLTGLARNPPDATTDVKSIGDDLRGSIDTYLDHAYWDLGDIGSLLTSTDMYLNARLANLYGAPAPSDTSFALVQNAPGRVGLLAQPALMAMLAHADQTAPVQRGVFVRQQLLCIPVDPPPPGFNPVAPDPNPMLTTRERFKVHTAEPGCAGCHKALDGVGFGFENFDQLGNYRTSENSLPIDASGEMLGTPDDTLNGPFNGEGELSARLAQSPLVQNCVATNWYRYAFGRTETPADGCSLIQAEQAFTNSGGRFKELLVALTLTDAFRYRPPLPEEL